MASALATFIREQMGMHGWNQTRLAQQADMSPNTLSGILNNPNIVPEIPNFVKLANALGVPLRGLLAVAGYAVEPIGVGEFAQERVGWYLQHSPWLAGVMDDLIELDVNEQQALRAFLDTLKSQRARRGVVGGDVAARTEREGPERTREIIRRMRDGQVPPHGRQTPPK